MKRRASSFATITVAAGFFVATLSGCGSQITGPQAGNQNEVQAQTANEACPNEPDKNCEPGRLPHNTTDED